MDCDKSCYDDSLDSVAYLRYISSDQEEMKLFRFLRQCLHDFFSTIDESELMILDYGGGPNIVNQVSASTKAKEIVMADYCKPNREFVKKWCKDKMQHDFSTDFRNIVCKLEGKSETEALKRQEIVQRMIKAVVSCDITQDVFIEKGYEGPYDVVTCLLCLENVPADLDEYGVYLDRVLSLVGESGYIVLYNCTSRESRMDYYKFDGKRYKQLFATDMFFVSHLERNGFVDISIKHLEDAPCLTMEGDKVSFITARKTK